jgi:hypothetical protein
MSVIAALSNLPRELRDHVYSYLTEDASSECLTVAYPHHEISQRFLLSHTAIVVHNHPICSERLELGNLGHEYLTSSSDARLSATIRTIAKATISAAQSASFNVEQAASHLVDFTIYIDANVHNPGHDVWTILDGVFRHAMPDGMRPRRIRIASICSSREPINRLDRTTYSDFTAPPHQGKTSFLQSPPDWKQSLPLVQRGEAYRLYDTEEGCHCTRPSLVNGICSCLEQIVTKLAWYAFGKESEGGYWMPGELEREWPVGQLGTEKVEEEDESALGLTLVASGKREKRGHGEAVAWFC